MAIWQEPTPASKTPCCWIAVSKIIWNPCRSDGEWSCLCTMIVWRWSKPDSKTGSAGDSWIKSVNSSHWPSSTLHWSYQCSWQYYWPMLFSFDHAVSFLRINYSHSRRFIQCYQNICIKPYLVIWFVYYIHVCTRTKHLGTAIVGIIELWLIMFTVTKTHLLSWNIYLVFFVNSIVSIF